MLSDSYVAPEFWTTEKVVTCSPSARLLFIGLWNLVDDDGSVDSSIPRMKIHIFPGDDCTCGDIKRWLDELEAAGLVKLRGTGEPAYCLCSSSGMSSSHAADAKAAKHRRNEADRIRRLRARKKSEANRARK